MQEIVPVDHDGHREPFEGAPRRLYCIERERISERREGSIEANFRRSILSAGRKFNENGASRRPKGTGVLCNTTS